MTVGPAPRAQSNVVATKYTADLPRPVRCTMSTRRRSATSALIAVHWSSRSRDSRPASACRRRAACEAQGRLVHIVHALIRLRGRL